MTAVADVVAPSFTLPSALEAREPAEARGLARDEVRLMVSFTGDDAITHTRFTRFADQLRTGDVLVVNTSATRAAAVPASRSDGEAIALHLSQRLRDGQWVVELRRVAERGTVPLRDARAGEHVTLPAGARATLHAPYGRPGDDGVRLWRADLSLGTSVDAYLARHGAPIRYGYVPRPWPIDAYQTIFADELGSAEMPSAARPFTTRTLDALAQRGVIVSPITLHAGVSSLEDHEPPYAEYARVGPGTARIVSSARDRGARIVAVGTTAVRALESAATADGRVSPFDGWTDLVIERPRRLHVVDALLTGFHAPRASHLAMLDALAGQRHVERAYAAALHERYLWHEFGDVHLILPGRRIDG